MPSSTRPVGGSCLPVAAGSCLSPAGRCRGSGPGPAPLSSVRVPSSEAAPALPPPRASASSRELKVSSSDANDLTVGHPAALRPLPGCRPLRTSLPAAPLAPCPPRCGHQPFLPGLGSGKGRDKETWEREKHRRPLPPAAPPSRPCPGSDTSPGRRPLLGAGQALPRTRALPSARGCGRRAHGPHVGRWLLVGGHSGFSGRQQPHSRQCRGLRGARASRYGSCCPGRRRPEPRPRPEQLRAPRGRWRLRAGWKWWRPGARSTGRGCPRRTGAGRPPVGGHVLFTWKPGGG